MPTFYLDYENGNDDNDGSSWALAWKTFASGATAARTAPGDTIRIAKSPDPVSIGQATWTYGSKTVTLDSALTTTVDNCDVIWTAANGSTVSLTLLSTTAKEGTGCAYVRTPASVPTSTLMAYKALSSPLNLSAYDSISFWIATEVTTLATHWVVALCSDNAGAVPVDTFTIPAIPLSRWTPLTLSRVGGGNLSNGINSIAVYTGSVAPTASKYIRVDHFIACLSSSLTLNSLIGKSSTASGGDHSWHCIQSINGTTVLLDNSPRAKANEGKGYGGSTEQVTTYKRETIKTQFAVADGTLVNSIQESGTQGSLITYSGGWNTSTSIQDGETFFDGTNANGYGIHGSLKSYIGIDRISTCRYFVGYYLTGCTYCNISLITAACNCGSLGVYLVSGANYNTISTIVACNNNYTGGIQLNGTLSNIITLIKDATSNITDGISIYNAYNNAIATITNANNNLLYGINLGNADYTSITTIGSINTNGNGIRFVGTTACASVTQITNIDGCSTGVYFAEGSYGCSIGSISSINDSTANGIYFNAGRNNRINQVGSIDGSANYGIYFYGTSFNNFIGTVTSIKNGAKWGVVFDTGWHNTICSIAEMSGNTLGSVYFNYGRNYIHKLVTTDSTTFGGISSILDTYLFVNKLNAAGLPYVYTNEGYMAGDVDNRHTASGMAWKLAPTSDIRMERYPLILPIASVYADGVNSITVKAWVKKSHATDIGAKLVCRMGQLSGITTDVVATKANDTDYEELSITVSPSEAGIVEIEIHAYWIADTADEFVYVDDVTLPASGISTFSMDKSFYGQPWISNANIVTRSYAS